MANGILIVDKPADWTSQDVVSKLRGAFHERRVGHGGTLDPMATGVLPVFFGRATRAVEFFEHAQKAYVAHLLFGTVTDTQDTTGTVLQTSEVCISEETLTQTLDRFTGPQQQLPPMYSAIKVGGKKLYELARAGKEVARRAREITVFSIRLLAFDGRTAELYIHCSKGTYVRTLCHDIGAALGCGGCMAALRRVQAGAFGIEQAIALPDILSQDAPEALLLPVDSLFLSHPVLPLTAAQEKCVRNGAAFSTRHPSGTYRVYGADSSFLALGEIAEGKFRSLKSFF